MDDPLSLAPATHNDRKTKRALVLLGIILLCLLVAVLYWRFAGQVILSEQAVVEGRTFSLTAPASGQVQYVNVSEGQEVRQGDVLLQLDDGPLRTALAEARAALEIALQGGVPGDAPSPAQREATELASVQAEAERAKESQARRHLEHWTAEHAKAMLVLRNPGAPEQQREAAVKAEADARASMEQARKHMEEASRYRATADAELRRVRDSARTLRPGPQQVALWQARVEQAQEDVAAAQVLAPQDSRVAWLSAHSGQRVQRGDRIMLLIPLPTGEEQSPGDNLWVTARFSRSHMLELRVGQTCRVTFEDGATADGVISHLLPEQGGTMARIHLLSSEGPLYPGLNAQVTVRKP